MATLRDQTIEIKCKLSVISYQLSAISYQLSAISYQVYFKLTADR
ncbi:MULTISPECIES: hypothetical protein [unclassified Moorena]|nr:MULTISPECIES: hypothetical protein [unclassified Moorena]